MRLEKICERHGFRFQVEDGCPECFRQWLLSISKKAHAPHKRQKGRA